MSVVAVLRPEPGNARTVARVRALGHEPRALPLFAVVPVAWTVPPGRHDALMLTSANALRHGGAGLADLRHLPVAAVGAATAAAARLAGFRVVRTGRKDAAALLADMPDRRILHLAGRDRAGTDDPRVTVVTAYRSDPLPGVMPAAFAGTIALLHSARAARRLAELVDPVARRGVRLAAISAAALAAAGPGWAAMRAADRPEETALLALLATLAD